MGIEEVVPKLKTAAKQHSKDAVIQETLKLLKQLQTSRSTLFQKGIEAPTVAELEKYGKSFKRRIFVNDGVEKEIRSKFLFPFSYYRN